MERQGTDSKGRSDRNVASQLKDNPDALPCVNQIFVTPKPPHAFLTTLKLHVHKELNSDLFPPANFASCSDHQKIQF